MAKAKEKAPEEKAPEVKADPKALAMSAEQDKAQLALSTVSARIRYLNAQGYTRSEISKLIPNASGGPLRYQHVNNVLQGPTPKTK